MQRSGRRRARPYRRARIVAVTGSVGKTGTKEMLKLALGPQGPTYASAGSLNNHWGVPLSLARLPREARFGVFELGMNHRRRDRAADRAWCGPMWRSITTVEAVHLEFFASTAEIADAKAEIFDGMEPGGTADPAARQSPLRPACGRRACRGHRRAS